MSNTELSKKDFEQIYLIEILPDFEKKIRQSEKRCAYILGGQPGAGKSEFIKIIEKHHKKKSFSVINGDDLRSYHPFYTKFLAENEENAADLTQVSVNYWVERLINEVSERQGDMIIEGTMKNPNVPISTAELLKRKDYTTEANIILTNPEVSKVDMLRRYFNQKDTLGYARFTKPDAHKNVLKKLLESIVEISKSSHFNDVKVFRRVATEYKEIFNRNSNDDNEELMGAIRTEMSKKYPEEEEYIESAWEELFSIENLDEKTIEFLKEMKAEKVDYDFNNEDTIKPMETKIPSGFR